MTTPINLDAYFERIQYTEEPDSTLSTLQRLHLLHPQAITFENLSTFLDQPVMLDNTSLQDKLLRQKRGGYCYEQNALFREVLTSLGFNVRGILARVEWFIPAGLVLPRSHMALLVTIADDVYLADVGFGGMTLTAPLDLHRPDEQSTPHGLFRIEHADGLYRVLARIKDHWQPVYGFDLQEQQPADYEVANWYTSTHPTSRFRRDLIVTRIDQDRRHVLVNNEYTTHHNSGSSETTPITDIEQMTDLLINQFHLPPHELMNDQVREKLAALLAVKH